MHDLLLVELFNAEYYGDLEMCVRGHSLDQGHWRWYHAKAWARFPIHIP